MMLLTFAHVRKFDALFFYSIETCTFKMEQ